MKSLVLALACAVGLSAQTANPMSDDIRASFNAIKNNLLKAAEKMPEASYAFKPSHDVRSFAQLVGHVTDANFTFCSAGKAEADVKKAPGAEKALSKKDELVAALKDAIAYCDTTYGGLTDAALTSKVKMFGRDATLITVLWRNVSHDNEHYGNIVTYMRIRGFVPPSSEGR